MFKRDDCGPDDWTPLVAEARKGTIDARTRYRATSTSTIFRDDAVFEEIQFVDFYRYWSVPWTTCSTPEDAAGWIALRIPDAPTNCLINDVGIYIHKKQRGFTTIPSL